MRAKALGFDVKALRQIHRRAPRARVLVMDYLDVVVHIFTPEARGYYRLEELWGEKPVRMKIGGPPSPRLLKAAYDVTLVGDAEAVPLAEVYGYRPGWGRPSEDIAREITKVMLPEAEYDGLVGD